MDRCELETGRLRLRQFCGGDLDAYARLTGDAETMRYIGQGEPLDREGAWRSLAYILGHWWIRGFGLWAAVTAVGVRRAISAVVPENAASIRVAEKLGMHCAESRQIAGRSVSIYAIERRD